MVYLVWFGFGMGNWLPHGAAHAQARESLNLQVRNGGLVSFGWFGLVGKGRFSSSWYSTYPDWRVFSPSPG